MKQAKQCKRSNHKDRTIVEWDATVTDAWAVSNCWRWNWRQKKPDRNEKSIIKIFPSFLLQNRNFHRNDDYTRNTSMRKVFIIVLMDFVWFHLLLAIVFLCFMVVVLTFACYLEKLHKIGDSTFQSCPCSSNDWSGQRT